MKSLTIREMRSALSHLDRVLAEEGELLVTRRGRALARIVPLRAPRQLPSHADLRARMPRLSPSAALVRKDRDGR